MEQPKYTFHDGDPWMDDYKKVCNCNRGFIGMFYCNVSTCEDNKEYKLYCTQCVIFDGRHSAHGKQNRVTIKDEVKRIEKEWMVNN